MSIPNQTNITATLIEKELFEVTISEKDIITVDFTTIDYIPHRKSFYSLTDTEFVTLENNQVAVYDETTQKWLNKDLEDIIVDVLFIENETPTEVIATQFRTAYIFKSATLQVYLNGLKFHNSEITVDDNRTFTIPIAKLTTDVIEVAYIRDI